MTPRLHACITAAWLLAGTAATGTALAAGPSCTAIAARAPGDPRIQLAVDEARRQHRLFGGQTVERDGGLSRVGHHEAEWSRVAGEPVPAWARVAAFWRALSASEPPTFSTSAGRVARELVAPAVGNPPAPADAAIQEALLRVAIIDTPWSAAFISYLMKTAGFTGDEFAFSDSHADYVRAALDASAAEAAGQPVRHAFRACDAATTRPRAGDLLCATRASTAGTARFDALPAAMAARAPGAGFPMHCDLVVRSDAGGDAKLETIGGNVVNSVTLSRMTLNARKVLSDAYVTGALPVPDCARAARGCPDHHSRRPWLVLLQFRN